MKPLFLIVLFFLFLNAVSAEIVWQYGAGAPISLKPVVFGNLVLIGTQAGGVHAVSLATGTSVWKQDFGDSIIQPALFSNNIVVATSNGTVALLRNDGSAVWTTVIRKNATVAAQIYGLSAASDRIFVTTDYGVFSITSTGNTSLFFNATNATVYTAPVVSGQAVYFGAGNELVAVHTNRQVLWRKSIAPFGYSEPVIRNNVIYVGAHDNSLYAVDVITGRVIWQFEANGWVASTPAIDGTVIYFGSNDGNIYAVDSFDGALRWKTRTELAVHSTPLVSTFAGQRSLFVGGTDGTLYVLSVDGGQILWKFAAQDWVASPAAAQGDIVVGGRTGILYRLDTVRGCTITEPKKGSVVGRKEIRVRGTVLSEAANPDVSVRVNNDGPWIPAMGGNGQWELKINPADMDNGGNRIFCKVFDSAGEENEPYFSLFVFKDPNQGLSNLVVNAPSSAQVGTPFTVFVSDGGDTSPIEEFNIVYDGEKRVATGNITLNISTPGVIIVNISKIGYTDAVFSIAINEPNQLSDLALPAIGGLTVLALVYFVILKRILRK